MEPIGYVPVQLIPTMDGWEKEIDSKFVGPLLATGKKGGKQLAKGVGDGLKDLEREVESASKAYDKLRDRAADALDKITVEEKKLAKARAGGKEDQIAAAEARLNKARRDSARYSREAEQAHGALTAAQKRLGDGADDTGRRMGGLGTSMRNMGAIAGGAALVGVTALAAGVATASNRLYELGADLDEVSDNLQIKTGLTGSALDKLRDSVEKLGTTNVPSSFSDISDVAAEVTRNLHLTDQPLEDVTSRLANLARFGQSTDVRSLAKVFNGFKIGAEDQAGALNALYEVSTKTGLSIDDLTGALANGGAPLRALNLGFDDSIALMYAFESAGLSGEKATTALNKAFGYFATEGIPAEEGLSNIIARIRELGDTPEAAELSKKVFGGKGGAQFFEAIQNGDLDLQNLQSSLQLTGLDINQVSDDTADWSEKWQDLQNDVAVALKPVATPLFDTVNGKLGELSTWVTDNQDKVIDFFVSMGEGAISAAEVTLTALAGVVDTLHLFDTLVMKGFSWLPGYDDAAAKEFNDALGDLSTGLHAVTDGTMFEDLRDGLHDVADEAKNANDSTADAADSIGDVGQSAGTSAGDVDTFRQSLEDLAKVKPPQPFFGPGNTPPWFTPGAAGGATPGQNPLDPSVLVPGGLPAGLRPGGGGSGVGINLQLAADKPASLEDTGSTPSGPQSRLAAAAVEELFGDQLRNPIGGSRDHDTAAGTHDAGLSIDIPIGPDQMALGDEINAYLQANADTLGLKYTIWRNKGDYPNTPGTDFDQSGHMDHIDAHFSGTPPGLDSIMSGAGSSTVSGVSLWDEIAQAESSGRWADNNSGGHSTSSGAPRGGLQITDGTWNAFGGSEFAPTANLATRDEQIAVAERIAFTGYKGTPPQGLGAWEVVTQGKTPNVTTSTPQSAFGRSGVDVLGSTALNNAYGAGYEPGIGTPGTNEYGEPGYFEVDPRDVQDAQDRITDQYERIRESDEAARQAQVAIDELEADADQSEKDAAVERKRKADYDAGVARRELKNLELDLAEAKKGTFSPARESSRGRSSGSGSGLSLPSSFSDFGSAIGEFAGGQIGSALDVFGVGDSPGWLKGLSEAISVIGGATDENGDPIFDGGNLFGGGSAAPLSASPAGFGVPPPIDGNVHGTRAGQAPGVVYNIRTATVEDAFLAARRREDERAARPLARF